MKHTLTYHQSPGRIAPHRYLPPGEGKMEAWEIDAGKRNDLEWEDRASRNRRDYIRRIQANLNQIMGLKLNVDGILGSQTRTAIRAFQKRQGLRMDGIPGEKTEAAIRTVIARQGSKLPAYASADKNCEMMDYFDFDRSNVKNGDPRHQAQLRKIINRLIATAGMAPAKFPVRFIGHTDPVGSESYNDELGLRRAKSVRTIVMQKLKDRPDVLAKIDFLPAESRGEKEPRATDEQSRRVSVCFPAVRPSPSQTMSRSFEVVAKSFIAPLGAAGVGTLSCSSLLLGPLYQLTTNTRLEMFAKLTLSAIGGGENPLTSAQDRRYRLFSRSALTVECKDGRITGAYFTPLITDVGLEQVPGSSISLEPPPLITSPVAVKRPSPNIVEFSWRATGRPHNAAEPGFQAVCPRTSRYIWHFVNIRIECSPAGVKVSNAYMTGSQFPSHRLFIDGRRVADIVQGPFRNLWIPSPALPAMVR